MSYLLHPMFAGSWHSHDNRKVYWDSDCFIAYLQAERGKVDQSVKA
jgi:hypothetical protein